MRGLVDREREQHQMLEAVGEGPRQQEALAHPTTAGGFGGGGTIAKELAERIDWP